MPRANVIARTPSGKAKSPEAKYDDMMSLTDDEQDVASRLPTPQKQKSHWPLAEARAAADENLSPTAVEAVLAAEQRRRPRRPPPPMPRATPPATKSLRHRLIASGAVDTLPNARPDTVLTPESLDDDESSEDFSEDPRADEERRARERQDAPSELWTPVGPLNTFGREATVAPARANADAAPAPGGSPRVGSPRAGSPRPSLLDRARRISPPPSRSQSPPSAPAAKPSAPLAHVVSNSDATRPSPASSVDSEAPGRGPQGWRRRRAQMSADARVRALEEEAAATKLRHRGDLASIREARESADARVRETQARLDRGRARAMGAAGRLLARLPAKRNTRRAFSSWRVYVFQRRTGMLGEEDEDGRSSKAPRSRVRGLAALAILVAAAAGAYYTARDLGFFLDDAPASKHCRELAGSARFASSEDVGMWTPSEAVVTAGGLRSALYEGGRDEGALFAVAFADDASTFVRSLQYLGLAPVAAVEPVARKLFLEAWPHDKKFRPHGIHVRRPHIFVVNHGLESGSSIEVFEGVDNGTLVGARWVRTVAHPLFAGHGRPNAVVAVAPDEVYVTTWRFFPLPVQGVSRASVVERLALAVQFAANILRLPVTRVYRCVFAEGVSCAPVGARHAMANGLALGPDGMLYVVDVLRFSVTVYERRRDGSLVVSDTIHLPHAADNVYARPDGSLLLGSMPKLHQCLDPLSQTPPVVTGALTLATPRPPTAADDRALGVRGHGDPRWTFVDVVRTDRQVSGGALVGGRALVGSPWGRGALLCDLPPEEVV